MGPTPQHGDNRNISELYPLITPLVTTIFMAKTFEETGDHADTEGESSKCGKEISMTITSASPTDAYAGASGEAAQLRLIRTQLRSLGDGDATRFSVVRDPDTQRFVVQVLDPESKAVVDQFPAENILKRQAARQAAREAAHEAAQLHAASDNDIDGLRA